MRVLERLLAVLLCLAPLSSAEVQYQQTSRMTGGSLMQMMKYMPGAGQLKEPQVSTVAFQDNRMARRSTHNAEIIDLDKKTITTINLDRKTYSVMTFDQMKHMMEQMSSQQPGQNATELKFDMDLKDTGETKNISGMSAKEILMTVTMSGSDAKSGATGAMKMDSSMWITKDVPGGAEIHDFHMRMAKEIDWAPSGMGGMMNRPDLARAMSKMMAEGGKMEGTTILQTMKMYGSMTGMPDGAGGDAPARPSMSDAVSSALGSKLGGFGGFGKKKKDNADTPAPTQTAAAGSQAPGTLMEMTIESTGFKQGGVDASLFSVPAGFTETKEDPTRRGR